MYETKTVDKAFLVGIDVKNTPGELDIESSLNELERLADTAGFQVVGRVFQRVQHPDPATYIRSGKVEEVRNWVQELSVNTVLFDDELNPRHQRELEKTFGEDVRVLDRTALILDIFAQHASTKEGALQVELAQYQYRLPRLTRAWTHLARQAGGAATRGGVGGVGLRGPGESQLETDRREIGRKISYLKNELEKVRSHRKRYRAKRRRAGIPVVALVGYTNAGKSTLLNRISGADVYAADQLFATLDPTTRRVTLPNGQDVLITDTVGFIQKLPTSLVAAFRATLEEVAEADLLLHVIDASHPNAIDQAAAVEVTLTEDLGIEDLSLLVVLNKSDRLAADHADTLDDLRDIYPEAVTVSGLTGAGIPDLMHAVEERLKRQLVTVTVSIPYDRPAVLSRFYDLAEVIAEEPSNTAIELTGLLEPRYAGEFTDFRI